MKISSLSIPDILLIVPPVFSDERGYFCESFNLGKFCQAIGRELRFVQNNESLSVRHVIRGLHYQVDKPQGKLVRVVEGMIFDVAVDLRRSSPTFGQWTGALLSDENQRQLWLPEGFAHGFQVISERAKIQYMVTEYWYAQYDRCIRYDDSDIAVKWKNMAADVADSVPPLISRKDSAGTTLAVAEVFP
ncbi:dTDP-4-dehydrorhamnose 3,5-epimerase [Martelella alba]|uniref:dTDP-4-dehydrorhamnose 3,5-epimerase n=1 Tax=Martelella alba TaxID=2590451 RepID=A0ABY2SGF5_9HYPH|nr:dTDP-4-dehydrorhamnose 3,5-epimerase [Martelella alba]TKI04227.1 dTDP-4-dehydrorhamnose 3,5-epimerase [Martelella alba]